MRKLLTYLLNFLLPRDETAERLELMSVSEFRDATRNNRVRTATQPSDVLSLFDYQNPLVRQAIWELKYRGNKKIARLLAECLYEELTEEIAERATFENFGKPLVVGIPLYKERERERGFNQCDLLVYALAELDKGNLFETTKNLLKRIRYTESQTKKNRAERLKNLEGCFAVENPDKLRGRSVILLDDVTTTGATLDEASKTLLRAGAGKILKTSVAH